MSAPYAFWARTVDSKVRKIFRLAMAAELDAFLRHPDVGGAVFRQNAGPVWIPVGPLPGGPLELPLAFQLLLHAPVGQREHLEAAAVGDQRPVPPSDKIMQPPGTLDNLQTTRNGSLRRRSAVAAYGTRG